MHIRALVLFLVCAVAHARRKETESEEDFEFIEDTKDKNNGKGSLVWISDPNNELCNLLRCSKDEICLLQDRFTAVCVNKEEAEKYGDRIVPAKDTSNLKIAESKFDDYVDEDDDEDDQYLLEDDGDFDDDDDFEVKREKEVPKLIRKPFARKKCPTCPVVKPIFLCGSDNRTYSSLCRLHLHNCLHDAKVTIACKGFCPCKDSSHQLRKDKQRQRMNSYMKKLRTTAVQESEQVTPSHASQSDLKPRDSMWKRNHKSKYSKKYAKTNDQRYFKHPSKYAKQSYKSYDKYWDKKGNWADVRKNEVNYKSYNTVWGTNECSEAAMEAMGNRMLDWFSVIMSDSRRRTSNPMPGPSWCKKEVSWMLGHLDQNNDQILSSKELYRLEHDDRERCIKPFIDRCDLNRDLYLSGREWCKCFDQSQRPCAALRKASKGLLGGYIPECDSDGYYRPTQCHVSAAMCWCVGKHGVEISGTRTREAPHCEGVTNKDQTNSMEDDTESDPEDLERYEGSADMPLDI